MKQPTSHHLTENQQLALIFLGCCCSLSAVIGWALHMWLGRGCP